VQVYGLLWLNIVVLIGVFGMILWLMINTAFSKVGEQLIAPASGIAPLVGMTATADNSLAIVISVLGASLAVVMAIILIPATMKLSHHSMWSHPHFSGATLAQFLYVAAQAGIFSFFINCMTPNARTGFCMVPHIPDAFDSGLKTLAAHLPNWGPLQTWLSGWFEVNAEGVRRISDAGGSALQSMGFVCFLAGRVFGSWLLKRLSAHKVLGAFNVLNIVVCFGIFLNLGWISTACVFLSFFFMSITFPTIFALGIFGLGQRAKRASAYIVMAIMGGAVLPKLMGHVADVSDMCRAFSVPMACFACIAVYAYLWPKLSNAESLHSVSTSGGH
jgi:FHS family L-fucose permease-like MFS transporter